MSIALESLPATELNNSPLLGSEEPAATLGTQRRRQELLVALGRRVIAPPDVALLIQDAAALIAETLDVELYGVAELQDDNRLWLRSWPVATGAGRKERAYSEAFVQATRGQSLAGFALATAETLGVADLSKERRFADCWLADQQVCGAVAVPLQLRDEAYGALVALSRQPRRFTIDDVLFAETIGHMVSTTIGRDRAVKALDQERTFTNTVLETVEALVMVLNPSGRIVRVNRAFERTIGFKSDDVRDRPIWNFLLVPEEIEIVRAMLRRSAREAEPVEHESFILTQRGERRRIRWSYATLNRAAGEGAMIVATGIDVTVQRNAESRLQELQAADEAKQQGGPASLAAAALPLPDARDGAAPPAAADSGRDASTSPFHPLPPGPRSERRKRPRRAFGYFQRIAPYDGQKLPPPAMFCEVRCWDISAGGFSFVSSRPPEHTDYVVALGACPGGDPPGGPRGPRDSAADR